MTEKESVVIENYLDGFQKEGLNENNVKYNLA